MLTQHHGQQRREFPSLSQPAAVVGPPAALPCEAVLRPHASARAMQPGSSSVRAGSQRNPGMRMGQGMPRDHTRGKNQITLCPEQAC